MKKTELQKIAENLPNPVMAISRSNTVLSLTPWELSQIKGLAESQIIDLESESEDLSDYGNQTLELFRKLLKKVS